MVAAKLPESAVPAERGRLRGPLRRFLQNWLALPALAYLCLVLVTGALAGQLAPHDPLQQDTAQILAAPSAAHLLGTDDLGRDVLSRLLYGARLSLPASLLAVAIALAVGVPLGLVSGYAGGLTDDVIMRVVDALQAFPAVVLAMAIAATLGPGVFKMMVAVGVVFIPGFARLVRGQVLAVREELYVEAAVAAGASRRRLLWRHILPNVLAPIAVHAALSLAFALLSECSLSFLGVGVQPPAPSWGADLGRAYRFMSRAPWLVFMPGLAIMCTTLAFNWFGDGLRAALDPRRRV